MSTHPNAILFVTMLPDDFPEKTFRAIAAEIGAADLTDVRAKVGEHEYAVYLHEEYDADGYQIEAPEGSIVAHDFLTYGYGDVIEWAEVAKRQAALLEWAQGVCERHKCSSPRVFITANYW